MRFHYKIDPNELGEEDWAKLWCDLKYALRVEHDLRNTDKLRGTIKNMLGGK